MTNETTTEETTPKSKVQIAEEFVRDNNFRDVVDYIVTLDDKVERAEAEAKYVREETNKWRTKFYSFQNTVEEFLKQHIADDDIADMEDLKELAEKLEIELTKEVEVTFTVNVKFVGTVPLDFDPSDINDYDFDVNVNYSSRDADLEEEYCEIDNFEVEEQ